MFTVFVVLVVLLYVASLIGLGYAVDNSPKKEDGTVQVTTGGGCVSLLTLLGSFMILAFLARSWAIVTLWGWFVTPVFNISIPTQAQAYGLTLCAALFSSTPKTSQSKTKGEYINVFVAPFTYTFVVVGMGWVIQRFAM